MLFFFFQAEDGIRDGHVTGVQTCALPIFQRERLVGGEGILARALALTARSGLLLGGLLLGRLLLGRLLLGRLLLGRLLLRSEERRVGKECIARRSRSR